MPVPNSASHHHQVFFQSHQVTGCIWRAARLIRRWCPSNWRHCWRSRPKLPGHSHPNEPTNQLSKQSKAITEQQDEDWRLSLLGTCCKAPEPIRSGSVLAEVAQELDWPECEETLLWRLLHLKHFLTAWLVRFALKLKGRHLLTKLSLYNTLHLKWTGGRC